eukprot:gene5014-6243_t
MVNQNITVKDEEFDIAYMRGYKKNIFATILHYGLVVCTGFLILLVYHWVPRWGLKMRYKESNLEDADYIYVKANDKTFSFCKVTPIVVGKGGVVMPGDKPLRMIIYKFTRFFYDSKTGSFQRSTPKTDFTRAEITDLQKTGLDTRAYSTNQDYFGPNIIDVPLKSIPKLLLDEVLHPFFIFQIYSIGLWCAEAYYYYAGAIFFIASVSAIITLRETRNNLIKLGEIARTSCSVNVLRGGRYESVNSETLVPGDIVEITKGLILPCDFCLLSGTIILNESMLTGESIPVTKYALEECSGDILSTDALVNKRCAISGGTLVVKTQTNKDQKILAMVTKTGWLTTKGGLVLSMLYPKSSHFKFFQQSIKFLLVLCSIAMVGFGISVWRLLKAGVHPDEVVVRALDLITIVVPPALPMAQSVGTGFSIFRLKKNQIFCISPPRVSMAGKVEVYCFDKTGTLTEDGLDLLGVLPSYRKNFAPMVKDKDVDRMTGPLFLTLASCHTLAHIDQVVTGDPLEEKIFQATKAILDDNHPKYCAAIRLEDKAGGTSSVDPNLFPISTVAVEKCPEICLVERFEFQSALQRMSVIIRGENTGTKDLCLVKGSPEMIEKLSLPESIPADFKSVLNTYTKKGYRVLGCGYKEWDGGDYNQMTKDDIRVEAERNLHFLGFIIMENKLKPETTPALKILKDAMIRIVMVTGDNVLTAISVSKECGLIPSGHVVFMSEVVKELNGASKIIWTDVTHDDESSSVPYSLDPHTLTINSSHPVKYCLAVTGDAWKIFYTDFKEKGPSIAFNQILTKGAVFARMTPDQKQNLVEELQELKLYVGMCGDGANDCGALKAAHVGISLSVAEASIAAPFTSTITNITCTSKLIREGRASLAISFKLFQFIGMYSLIQFTTVIFLYLVGSVLGNWMYLYQDLWMIFPLVIFMGRTEPCSKLSIKRPSSQLISTTVIGSLLSHVALTGAFQTIVFIYVQREKWYTDEHLPGDDQYIINYICTSLFIYGNFQYLIMCFIYSWGKPFLKSIYTNRIFFVTFLLTLTTTFLFLLVPTTPWEQSFFQIRDLHMEWRLKLLVLVAINAIASMGVEWIIIIYRNKRTKAKRKRKAQLAEDIDNQKFNPKLKDQYLSLN